MDRNLELLDKPLEGELLPPGPAVDFWPHPITSDGRTFEFAEEGATLAQAMAGKIPPGLDAVATVNGTLVAQSAWHTVTLRRDDVVQVRVRIHGGGGGSNPIAVILSIAVIIAAPYLAGLLAPSLGITSTLGIQLLGAGIAAAGLLVVNTLFPPRLPELPSGAGAAPPPQFSLSGGANRVRQHEPLLMLLGQHRMYPDVVAAEYTEYDENSDQFLNGIYDYGIGNLDIGPERFGETPLATFDSVTTQKQVDAVTLVAGNVDTITGGEFEAAYPNGRAQGSPWITRRTAADTTKISFDLVSMHFIAKNNGSLEGRTAFFQVQWKLTSASSWQSMNVDIVSPDGADARNPVRRTASTGRLTAGAYDVRVKIRANYDEDDDLSRITYRAAAPTIKAHQDETADFTGRNALAIRAKATGQLYGRLDRINADVGARVADWNGTHWTTVRVTSNPASILLWWFRGYRVDGTLRAGYGLTDDQIDFTSLERWHAFCAAQGLECNIVLSDTRNEDEIAMLIAQCGWARVDISTGKYGVIFEDAGRPVTAIVNPANIVAGSIAISYDNENLADEIIGTYLDQDSDWQENTLRRPVPHFTVTGEFPVTIRLEGITSGEQAAKEINRAAAAQFYHERQIVWEMDDEGREIGIGDVVGMANGLLGNGQGGRLITIAGDRRTVGTAFEVGAASGDAWLWLLDDTIMSTTWTRTDDREIRLAGAMAAAPDGVIDHPTAYRIMLFAASDPYTKVRITGIDATGPHRFRFTARDELQQYYDFRHSDLTAELIPVRAIERPCPEGFTVTETAIGERVATWTEPTVPFSGFHLRYGPAGTDFAAMRDLHEGLLSGSPWRSLEAPDQGTWRFGLAAVYPDGRRCDPVYANATLGTAARFTRYAEVEIYQVVEIGDPAPARPGADQGSFDFATKTLTPPTDWVGPAFPTFTASQVVYACVATADTSEGPLWEPDADDWIGPFIVGDANDLDLIYARFTTAPTSAPAPSAGVPTGWYTNVADVPAGSGFIYVAIGHRKRGETLYTWQLPTQLEAQVSRITTGADFPENPNFGDLHVQTDGTLYRYNGTDWDDTGVDLTGDPGTTTTVGSTRPSDPRDGDIHISDAGIVFRWDADGGDDGEGAWINTGVSLMGDDGEDGNRGSLIDVGATVPTQNATRQIGDVFVRSDGVVFRWQLTDPTDETSGSWVNTGTDITGPPGASVTSGSMFPSSPKTGDSHVRQDGQVWTYDTSNAGAIKTAQSSFPGSPASGDWHLDTDDGTVWSYDGTSWVNTGYVLPGEDSDAVGWYALGMDLTGPRGAEIATGAAVPTQNVGRRVGDKFIRADGQVFNWNGSAWVDTGIDITGPQGATVSAGATFPTNPRVGDAHVDDDGVVWEYDPTNAAANAAGWFDTGVDLTGPRGIAGTQWYSGSAAPAADVGSNGDFAIITSGTANGDVYQKVAGEWVKRTSLRGADGGVWHTGTGAPSNTLGNDDDWYFRTGQSDHAATIYRKVNGAWVAQIDIDDGTPGAEWHSASGEPSGTLGNIGDFYFRTDNGYVYEKTGATAWTFRRDITGPSGDEGGPGPAGPPGPRVWQLLWSGRQRISSLSRGSPLAWSGGERAADYDLFGVGVGFSVSTTGVIHDIVRVIRSSTTSFRYDQISDNADDSIGTLITGDRQINLRTIAGTLTLFELWGIRDPDGATTGGGKRPSGGGDGGGDSHGAVPEATIKNVTANFLTCEDSVGQWYCTFQHDDNEQFSSPTSLYDIVLSTLHLVSWSRPAGTVYVRARFTSEAEDAGTQGTWSDVVKYPPDPASMPEPDDPLHFSITGPVTGRRVFDGTTQSGMLEVTDIVGGTAPFTYQWKDLFLDADVPGATSSTLAVTYGGGIGISRYDYGVVVTESGGESTELSYGWSWEETSPTAPPVDGETPSVTLVLREFVANGGLHRSIKFDVFAQDNQDDVWDLTFTGRVTGMPAGETLRSTGLVGPTVTPAVLLGGFASRTDPDTSWGGTLAEGSYRGTNTNVRLMNGTYTVEATVTDTDGNSATTTSSITL